MNKHYKIILIVISVMMMLMMGSVYAWTVFRVEVESVYQINTTLSGLPYMVSLFCYAFGMMLTGRLIKPKRLTAIAVIGSLLIGLGWILSSYSKNIYTLTLFYGVFIGTGVGMIYGIPIYIIQKLFKDKSGFYTGIILLGFGVSPLITAPIANHLINTYNLSKTFLVFGIVALILLPIFSLFLKLRESNQDEELINNDSEKTIDFRFYIIYILFFIATTIGLMMIGLSSPIGVGYNFNPNHVALLVSLFAVFNGIARPTFGLIIDRKGFIFAAKLSYILIAIAALISIFNQGRSIAIYAISFGLFWFNLGAWLSLAPTVTKQLFGMKSYPKNFGYMFTAYGFGALFGVLLSGVLIDKFNGPEVLYYIILSMAIITIAVIFYISRKKYLQ